MEIGRDASPEYRRWYRVVDNLDGLTIDEVVAVFSHGRVFCIPLFEIDVNIVIEYFMCIFGAGGGGGGGSEGGGCWWWCCYSFPFWKSETARFYDDFVYFTKSGSIDNGREFLMVDLT
jgi:hypothetical protein